MAFKQIKRHVENYILSNKLVPPVLSNSTRSISHGNLVLKIINMFFINSVNWIQFLFEKHTFYHSRNQFFDVFFWEFDLAEI